MADTKPYGDVDYADPGYQSDKVKRYPLDSEEHVRAAWSYINMPKNATKYSSGDLASIKSKIKAAAKKYGIQIEEAEQKSALRFPKDNLVRMVTPGPELQETSDSAAPILTGHFTPFNQWTKIESTYEGRFMEQIAPGTFKKAFSEPHRSQIKVQFDHGQDKVVGGQIIGVPIELREDSYGAKYDVELFEGLPPLIMNGLRRGVYGSSFRFRVVREHVDHWPEQSSFNPDRLPQRTIQEVEMFEFGPVVNPAYAGATAGIRSATDWYVARPLLQDPQIRDILLATSESIAPSTLDAADAEPHLEKERSEARIVAVPVRRRFQTQEGFLAWLNSKT